MVTLYITHPDCKLHDAGVNHPESPKRLIAINEVVDEMIKNSEFAQLAKTTGVKATELDLLRAHTQEYISYVFEESANFQNKVKDSKSKDHYNIDEIKCSFKTLDAAMFGVGCVVKAVDEVIKGNVNNAFCGIRPPGHHATKDYANGFCLFNNVAIGALTAIEKYGLKRVAIIDPDVHHGNGTQDIMWDRQDVFYASLHRTDIFPGTGFAHETGKYNNILNMPISLGTKGDKIKKLFNNNLLPRLENFKPEAIFLSSGYDAHRQDPLGGCKLIEEDYAWMTQELLNVANKHSKGRFIAVLEGGYNSEVLASSVAATLKVMTNS